MRRASLALSRGLASSWAPQQAQHVCSPRGLPLPFCPASSQPPRALVRTCVGKSRAYPEEPRVGVGVVVFKHPPRRGDDPEVLLVQRGKEPDRGKWCFPGGSLELGETLAACAVREVEEESGLRLMHGAAPSHAPGSSWQAQPWNLMRGPTPFSAVDVMRQDRQGSYEFHYAVIEVAAVCADPSVEPVPGDDAEGVQWVRVSRLRGMPELTHQCDEMAEEAARRFSVDY